MMILDNDAGQFSAYTAYPPSRRLQSILQDPVAKAWPLLISSAKVIFLVQRARFRSDFGGTA